MNSVLATTSTLLWWVLYSSMAALVFALIGWSVLRWTERCAVVFNRIYLACLLWTMAGLLLVFLVAVYEGALHPPYGGLLRSGLLRVALVRDMLIGAHRCPPHPPRQRLHGGGREHGDRLRRGHHAGVILDPWRRRPAPPPCIEAQCRPNSAAPNTIAKMKPMISASTMPITMLTSSTTQALPKPIWLPSAASNR